MHDDDKRRFAEIYRGVCANYGKEATREAMRMIWAALAAYDIQQVDRAFTSHVMTSRFMPTIADIRALIESSNPDMQRPGANEAWAMMPRSDDDSVVWTEEMCEAWAVASHLVNPYAVEKPDWVAARMAYKDAYERAVNSSAVRGKPVRWVVSLGHDMQQLADVVHEAIQRGRLSHEEARPYLLTVDASTAGIAGLLEGGKASGSDQALEAIAALKGMLKHSPLPSHDLDAVRAECEAHDRAMDAETARRVANV